MPQNKKRIHGKLLWSGLTLVAIALASVVLIALLKGQNVDRERERLISESDAGQLVRTATVTRSSDVHKLVLTGDAIPYTVAILYGKVAGYLSTILVDKGDLVKKGKLLATIESPETDQAYEAAVANATNLRLISAREKVLLDEKLVSPQEAEQAFANADVADAQVRQAKALKNYERIVAPFDGKITARFVDPGALIPAATAAQAGATAVVTISEVYRLRIYVFVDQRYARSIQPGLRADVSLVERPSFHRTAPVARLAGALDAGTRMLLTEVDVNNKDLSIVPGSLVQVTLTVRTPPSLEIPVASLVIRDDKQFAGVITTEHTVQLRPIQMLENDGTTMRVTGQLHEGELVGVDLGNGIVSGSKVRVETLQPGRAPAARKSTR